MRQIWVKKNTASKIKSDAAMNGKTMSDYLDELAQQGYKLKRDRNGKKFIKFI